MGNEFTFVFEFNAVFHTLLNEGSLVPATVAEGCLPDLDININIEEVKKGSSLHQLAAH